MNGYEAIASVLKMEGVEWIACFPSNPLIEAVAEADIRPITFRQERGGIMAADAFSRMNNGNKPGIFASQGGPGVENSFGGIAQAWGDGVPIMYFPDGPGLYKAGVKPHFKATTNYQHISKWVDAPSSPDYIVPLLRRAFHALRNGRPGPVVYEIHRDVMMGEVTNLDSYKSPREWKVMPSRSDIKDAVTKLLSAKRPVISAGQGVYYAEATDELREFAELTQIPVITTMEGKGAISEDHPLALGAANRTAPLGVWTWLKESDVYFGIGTSLTRTNYGIDVPSEGKFMIHSTNNVDDINKDYSIDIGLPGDARLVLEAMIDEAKAQLGEEGRRGDTAVQEDVADVKRRWLEEWKPLLTADSRPINPYRLGQRDKQGCRPRQLHPDARCRTPPRPDHAVLSGHRAARIHRLGQDHAPGLRDPFDDRFQDCQSRQVLHELHGRRGVRNVGSGYRNRGALRRPDHDDCPGQRDDGRLRPVDPDGDGEVRRRQHVR